MTIALVFEDGNGTVGAVHDDFSTTYSGTLSEEVDDVVDDVADEHDGPEMRQLSDSARSKVAIELFVEVPITMIIVPPTYLRLRGGSVLGN